MKKMNCRPLNGACDKVFEAETFEGMAAFSQSHTKEMMEPNTVRVGSNSKMLGFVVSNDAH